MDEPREIYPLRIFDNGLPVDADFRPNAIVNPVVEDDEVVTVTETVTETVIEIPVTDTVKSETRKAAARD